ncbi:ATP synthase F1 subunit epsilon [Candidatus Collierbacteria bacterium]|nr:ATP synthase F1 subunit epsilon [Candidatus Collierbacteria bacterium]
MNQLLHLSLATPSRQVLDIEDVEIVNAPAEMGDVGILPNHAPFLSKLRDGVINYKVGGNNFYVGVNGAFMDVAENQVTIISEAAILPEDADLARAQEAKDKAKAELEKKLEGTDFQMVEAELRRALLELKLLEHIKK